MAYSIKLSALILILLLSQIRVLSLTDKTDDSPIHIFLSFWGPDTRQDFTSLLYKELFRAGFNVFMNKESIRNGRDVDPGQKEAISKSMGAVIVFSKEFASSECCLDELVLIIKQRELRSDYILVPIYVEGVKPDDIGTKGGSYGNAIAKHKKKYWFWNKKDLAWWAALRKIEGYKGEILADRNWDMFFNEIVEKTLQEFSLMGITVNPRSEPSRRDPEDGLPAFAKFLMGLGMVGNFIDQNPSSFPVISQSSIQKHHQSVQYKKNVEFEKGSGSVWGWASVAAFTICFSFLFFIGCWKRSNEERNSIEDPADPPRMPETVIGTSTTSEQQNSAMARPINTPTRVRPEEEEESLVSGSNEVLNSSMVLSMEKAQTWIQPKPDPSCGIQKCKNLSRTSASPLEGNGEKEELESKCSFSPGDDSMESSITGSTSNAPKKSVIASTKEAPRKIQPKPNPQNSNNTKYPLGGEARVVLYTSYGPVYQTKFECNDVKDILRDAGVKFVERDASKDYKFKTELQKLMGDKLSYPRLVVRRRDVGEVEKLKNITHLMTIIND